MRHLFVTALALLWLAAWADPTPVATEALAPVAGEVDVASAKVPSLQLLWKASGFHQPEGAALAPDGGYFISSIGPGPDTERDGNGYISKLNPDGTVTNARFAVGLDAPLGLVVH